MRTCVRMRWKVTTETVEEPNGAMHRLGCSELREAVQVHEAGVLLERKVTPKECWRCEPALELVLGVRQLARLG